MELSEREKVILSMLGSDKSMSVAEIARKLFVSEPTLRRCLLRLANKGLVIRTHGGVMLNPANEVNVPLYMRMSVMTGSKREIAEKAASLVHDGDVIFIDASSTALYMLPHLKQRSEILAVTNGIKTAQALTEAGIHTVMLGGNADPAGFACNGYTTLRNASMYNADLCFFSSDAISADGRVSDNSEDECALRRTMMERSRMRVLLIDNSKFGKRARYELCTLYDIDYCFSDAPLPPELAAMPKLGCFDAEDRGPGETEEQTEQDEEPEQLEQDGEPEQTEELEQDGQTEELEQDGHDNEEER